jgi:glycine/D-amino acid oxidase-like deaminating enzyme
MYMSSVNPSLDGDGSLEEGRCLDLEVLPAPSGAAECDRRGEAGARLVPVAQPIGGTADVVVVGAGVLGLSAALRLGKAGLSVQVLEAGRLGECGSAIAAGQVLTGLKYDPTSLLHCFGQAVGERLIAFSATAADAPFTLIRHEGLAVPHSRGGWVQLAHSRATMDTVTARAGEWRTLGALASVLDAAEARRLTGASGYLGGWVDRRGGVVEPLAYVLELAAAAARWGVHIAQHSPAVSIGREAGRWRVSTKGGEEVRARFVLVATSGGAAALVPGLAASLVDMTMLHVATEPLNPLLEGAILPRGVALSDSRRLQRTFRRTADGRLVASMRGGLRAPRGEEDWAGVVRALRETFPVVARASIAERWYSRHAMTSDHLPHLHEPVSGLLVAAGCQARGLGAQTSLGQYLADAVLGGDRGVVPLPFTPIRPARAFAASRRALGLTLAWYRFLDRLEQLRSAA